MLMLVLAVKAAAHRCKGFGERKDFTADEQIAVLRADRMPEHAICRDRHLGHQIRPCQRNALRGDASQRDAPYHPVLLADAMGVEESAELLSLRVARHGRRQSHAESFGAAAAQARRISPMSGSMNGSPPVTKISLTPSSAASAVIRRTRASPSARRGALGEERTQQ